MEDIEDFYTYYVLLLGISEDVFWGLDYAAVVSIAANKIAYDGWVAAENERMLDERRRKRG